MTGPADAEAAHESSGAARMRLGPGPTFARRAVSAGGAGSATAPPEGSPTMEQQRTQVCGMAVEPAKAAHGSQ